MGVCFTRHFLRLFLFCASFAAFILSHFQSTAQIFWTEDFGLNNGTCDAGTAANNFTTARGTWTVLATGTNDPHANEWYISAAEAGQTAGNCSGNSCVANATLKDRSLHIANVAGSPSSAACPVGFDCGALYDRGLGTNDVTTNKRAISPTINCTGKTNLAVKFYYIEGGDGNDNGTFWYSSDGGTTWLMIDDPGKSTSCFTGNIWMAHYALLPASANNNANVKIGFQWTNNDDALGNNPSFAIDSIEVGTLPAAKFYANDTDICVGQSVGFYDQSTGSPSSWNWTFGAGTPPTSTIQNPVVRFDSVGLWPVQMTITNSVGTSSSVIKYINVHQCLPPTPNFGVISPVICETTCRTFYDSTSNNPTSWRWTFPGGTPDTSSSNQPTICYNLPGTYDVQLIASNQYGSDTLTKHKYIIVVDTCARPIANFGTAQDTICNYSCINFVDSTTNLDTTTTWEWIFPGAIPDTLNGNISTPTNICYNTDGSYDVTLIVRSLLTGIDTLTRRNFIVVRSVPGSFTIPDSTDSILYGQTATLRAFGGYSYTWSPMDSTILTSDTDSVITVKPLVTTTYTVAIGDSAGTCHAYRKITVYVLHLSKIFVPNSFAPDDNTTVVDNRYARVYGNNIATMRLSVYDRWGEKLFESTDKDVGWDGTYHGRKCIPGVYVYNVLITFTDATSLSQNGNITLVR